MEAYCNLTDYTNSHTSIFRCGECKFDTAFSERGNFVRHLRADHNKTLRKATEECIEESLIGNFTKCTNCSLIFSNRGMAGLHYKKRCEFLESIVEKKHLTYGNEFRCEFVNGS